MSCSTNVVYGYGISNEDIEEVYKHKAKLNAFLTKHKNLFSVRNWEMIEEDIEANSSDYFNIRNIIEDDYCNKGIGIFIKNVMSFETGINFEFCENSDSEYDREIIVLQTLEPWQFNDIEKKLTQEELKEIFIKFFEENFDMKVTPDNYAVSYYG